MAESFRVRPSDKERALAHYDACSPDYEAISAYGPLKILRVREHRAVLRYAELGPPARSVIDVGCGGGQYALAAKNAGLKVTAVDASPGMLSRIAPRVDRAILADLEELGSSLQGETFDIVICAGVLDFVLDPTLALRNLCRLVAPGGRLVLLVPNDRWLGILYRLEKRVWSGLRTNSFSEGWIAAAAAANGLWVAGIEHPIPTSTVVLLERRHLPGTEK